MAKKRKYTNVPGQIHIRYRGYRGIAEWDDEAKLYHGEVQDIDPDVVTFQASFFCNLSAALANSIEVYLEDKNGER